MGSARTTSRVASSHPEVPPAPYAPTLSRLPLPSNTREKWHGPGSLGGWAPYPHPSTHPWKTGPAAEPESCKPDGDQAWCQETARVPFKKCNLFLFPPLCPPSLQTITSSHSSPLPVLLEVTLVPGP